MKIAIPSPLQSYTGKKTEVDADGATLSEILFDLDRRYPGFRFRVVHEQNGIREHIRIFINGYPAGDLETPVRENDRVRIVCALSGG